MLNTLKMSFKIDTAYATNSFIYTLKKLPILKDILSDDLYSSTSLKNFIRVLGIILTSAKLILYRLLYFFIIYMIAFRIGRENLALIYAHIYVVFALIGLIINTNLLSATKKKYFSIILFQMDAKKYLCTDFVWGLILSFILNVIGFSTINYSLNIPVLLILGLSLFSSCTKIVGEAISIWFYRKKKYLLTTRYKVTFTYIAIMLVVSCLPLIEICLTKQVFIIGLILLLFLAVISVFYIRNVNDYKLIYKKLITEKLVMNEKNSEAYTRQAMVAIKDKDKQIDNKKLIGKKGYDLFNTIFFERHKEILYRSAKTFSLISAIVIVILIFLVLDINDFAFEINNILCTQIGWFVFIMYFINRGAIITQAMFYNCDHAMLTYNFYREPKILLNLFKKRLITIVKVNLMPAIIIAIGMIILLYFSGGTLIINYITIPLFIILLSIFFSVHYLVIYYLLQPFNKSLEMKKASYSLVSGLTYFISYTFSDLTIPSLYFSIGGLVFTILYIIIALFLIYKFAPKTFKINN